MAQYPWLQKLRIFPGNRPQKSRFRLLRMTAHCQVGRLRQSSRNVSGALRAKQRSQDASRQFPRPCGRCSWPSSGPPVALAAPGAGRSEQHFVQALHEAALLASRRLPARWRAGHGRAAAILASGSRCPARQHLIGGFAVDRLLVLARQGIGPAQRLALGIRGRPDAAGRRHDPGALGGLRPPLGVSKDTRASPTPSSVMAASISSPGLGRMVCAAVLTAFWSRREGAQRVLDAVAQLTQHRVGNIQRVLGDEIHPDAL